MFKKRIIVIIRSGLGNQLFTYAAARRLATVTDSELLIENHSHFVSDTYGRKFHLDKFNISTQYAGRLFRYLLSIHSIFRRAVKFANKFLPFSKRWYLYQEKPEYDSRLLNFKPKLITIFEDYWQSELYFKDIELQIRDEFKIKGHLSSKTVRVFEKIQSANSVALHIRFFDKVEDNTSWNATIDYYKQAISYIQEKIPDAHFFLFSDDLKSATNKLCLDNSCLTPVNHNNSEDDAYQDLFLMSNCKHFIIANSTFSWWGAWLSSNPEKIVIAPSIVKRDGDGSWGFHGLIPEEWIIM